MSTRLKVGFVAVLSCLTLLLGLFATTGIASAHSSQAAHTQTSQVSASTEDQQYCRRFWVQDWGGGYGGYDSYGSYGSYGGYGGRYQRGHWEWRCSYQHYQHYYRR